MFTSEPNFLPDAGRAHALLSFELPRTWNVNGIGQVEHVSCSCINTAGKGGEGGSFSSHTPTRVPTTKLSGLTSNLFPAFQPLPNSAASLSFSLLFIVAQIYLVVSSYKNRVLEPTRILYSRTRTSSRWLPLCQFTPSVCAIPRFASLESCRPLSSDAEPSRCTSALPTPGARLPIRINRHSF